MDICNLHEWNLTTEQAREVQKQLSPKIICSNLITQPRLIAGIDISIYRRSEGCAAVVLLDYPSLEIVESAFSEGEIRYPYVPGLLSFREAPLILEACRKLVRKPDLILVDGQGIAHPRRFGIAAHLGLLLNIPSIGCAKSRLIGDHNSIPDEAGKYDYLVDGAEIIGAAVRTRRGCKPVYISVGHMVDLPAAIRWTLNCCKGYRLPEPTRLAHIAAKTGPSRNFTLHQI